MDISQKLLLKIVDKQFTILGVKITYETIPNDGMVTNGKKKDYWYKVYKFTEEQEKEWKDWSMKELQKDLDEKTARKQLEEIELLYGLTVKYTKKGQLF